MIYAACVLDGCAHTFEGLDREDAHGHWARHVSEQHSRSAWDTDVRGQWVITCEQLELV